MSQFHFDAIVVGAGPGGATAAYDLAKAGARTLLLDKQKLPRHKTCGGGVTHKVANILPFDLAPVIERTINTVVFSYKMAQPVELRSSQPLVYMVRRNTFDNFLTEHAVRAGATLMDETAVQSLDVSESSATVRTNHGMFTSSWLIGADGATGTVARALGLMQDRILMPAVEEEVEVGDEVSAYWHDKMGLDLGSLPASYGWVFPKGDHLNVGVGGIAHDASYGKRLKQYDLEHLAKRVPQKTRVRKNFGYVLPLRKFDNGKGSPIHKGRALLIGDAAGLVEAFTGEGIYWAVRSGQLAAQTITGIGDWRLEIGNSANLQSPIPNLQSPATAYENGVNAELMPDLISARRWAHLYLWLPRFCYALPKRWQPMWRAVCKIVRGERGYSHIRKKLGAFGFLENLLPAAV
jgi:geranylgeranyl reductase family protein